MKSSILILASLITVLVHSQNVKQEKVSTENEIKVLAELIVDEGGSKVQISKYKVLKTIKGKVTNDTIRVGYYFYNELKSKPKTSILTLRAYNGNLKNEDYYIFPEYNPSKGIEKAQIATVRREYWEACETGKEICKPLEFLRASKGDKWFLILPCGGTETKAYFSEKKDFSKFFSKKEKTSEEKIIFLETEVFHAQCPPVFELTNLEDGKYFAYMMSCGLGGGIEINLKTKAK
ncbi:hypothetical protein [Kordia sp.]|uniref:hypothetical protein n=1 Tax=Kordia sp. TaxID=1965332 RepID=UPI003B59A530